MMTLDFDTIAKNALANLRKSKAPDLDLASLEQWLSEDEQAPAPADPTMPEVVELDEVTFQDLLRARHGHQDVRRKPAGGDFAEFLENDAKERRAAAQAIRKRRKGG